MSVLQRTLRMFVLAAAAMAGQLGFADGGYHPFSEPLEFNPDWQLFAPVQMQDLEELSIRQRAKHGLYLTYDRVYTGVSRSTTEPAGYAMDMTWGNRYDLGWMTNDESGWNFTIQNVGGPNAYNSVLQQRLNAVEPTDLNDPANPFVPQAFGNDPYYLERVYEIKDSLNVASLSSFEFNKSWRFEPYRYGGMLEPMIGMRYLGFTDTSRFDTYNTFIDPNPNAIFGIGNTIEQLTNDIVFTQNDMLLGQLGFRYTRFSKRVTWSSDFKAFAGHNFQTQSVTHLVSSTIYTSPPANGTTPIFDGDHTGTLFAGSKGHQTPVGLDFRSEGAFKITKYLDARAGFQLLYIGKGIRRTSVTDGVNFNNIVDRNNQHVVMPGFTFGIAFNR